MSIYIFKFKVIHNYFGIMNKNCLLFIDDKFNDLKKYNFYKCLKILGALFQKLHLKNNIVFTQDDMNLKGSKSL